MKLSELIDPDRIACNVQASSKKRALQAISGLLARSLPNMTEDEIFDNLLTRERLGSTGVGHGVAIPHARLRGNDAPIGAFLDLRDGVDYDAIDDQPVDLMFALLVPEESTAEHLQILAQLAEMFSHENLCEQLRHSQDTGQIFELLTRWTPHSKSA